MSCQDYGVLVYDMGQVPTFEKKTCSYHQWHSQEFCLWGGVQQIQLRTENRENEDLGAVAPLSGVLEAAVIWYKKYHFI